MSALDRADLVAWLAREGGLDPAALGPDTPLFSDGTLDSLLLIDLIGWLEGQTGRRLAWHEVTLENLDTIARIESFCAGDAD